MGIQEVLRKDIKALTAPGTRRVGSAGQAAAKGYLIQRMGSAGLEPYNGIGFELPYKVENTHYINLAGILPGREAALDPILLIAHYDTCGDQPGADDNAAAIATWLAVFKIVRQSRLQRDIIFLFPDAEEPPRFLTDHMGSTNFYRDQLDRKIHAGLVLDLVGHDVPMPGFEDLIFIFGAESHTSMANLLLDTELPAGLRNIATLNRYVGDLSDHHILRENDQPYLFFTCGRWQHYHQVSDIPEHLNYVKLERIVHYLSALIIKLDQLDVQANAENTDTVNMELVLLKRAIGPFLEQADIPMENRSDIQRFVLAWVDQYHL